MSHTTRFYHCFVLTRAAFNFFFFFVKKRTHGREELGPYACAINSKVEVSVLWGSLVLTEHFIRHCFAFFFFFSLNFNLGISRNPTKLVELKERIQPFTG